MEEKGQPRGKQVILHSPLSDVHKRVRVVGEAAEQFIEPREYGYHLEKAAMLSIDSRSFRRHNDSGKVCSRFL